MKNLLTLFLVLIFGSINAQIDVKISPIGSIIGSPRLEVDIPLSEFISIETSFLYIGKNTAAIMDVMVRKRSKVKGIGFEAMGKYFYRPDFGNDKSYVALYVRSLSFSVDDPENTQDPSKPSFDHKMSFIGVGLLYGKKWVFDNGIVLDLALGGGKFMKEKFNWIDSSRDDLDYNKVEFDMRGKLSAGYRF